MKRTALLLAIVAFLAVAQHGDVIAEDARTLKGEFAWGDRTSGDLEAVFTATGKETWDVSFHFEFRGQGHVYSGTAEGDLSAGGLEGKVKNEDKRRTFTFSGAFKDGTFEGTHAEITGGDKQSTGTLSLSE